MPVIASSVAAACGSDGCQERRIKQKVGRESEKEGRIPAGKYLKNVLNYVQKSLI